MIANVATARTTSDFSVETTFSLMCISLSAKPLLRGAVRL